jgi:hypothetical protein
MAFLQGDGESARRFLEPCLARSLELDEPDSSPGPSTSSGIPGCVTELGLATNDWTVPPRYFISADVLFRDKHLTFMFLPYVPSDRERTSAQYSRAFDVTAHLQYRWAHPDDSELGIGNVLQGQVEDDRETPRGACLSRVSGLRLWVTYVAPSN